MTAARRFRTSLLAWCGSLLFTLAFGELFVRGCTRFASTAPRMFVSSAILPWELKPGVRVIDEGYWQEFHVAVATNRLGFREDEFPEEKPRGVVRILVLGDSFTFGYGVEADEAYPAVLERLLNGHAPGGQRYEVINAGYASGYAPDTALVFFRHRGVRLDPDFVLWGYFRGNDLFDLAHTQWPDVDERGLPLRVTSDLYYVDTLGRLRTRAGSGMGSGLAGTPWEPLLRLKVLARDHSQLMGFLVQRSRLIRIARGRSANFDGAGNPSGPRVSDRGLEDKAGRVLEGLSESVARAGARFVVVGIPQRGTLVPDPARPRPFVDAWCAGHDIPFIDLAEPFADASEAEMYFRIDPHWTPRGHALAGRAIHEALRPLTSDQ